MERHKDGGQSKIVGNETMLGVIASFVENLHLSYSEVMNLPYETLILMQKDKLHESTGDILVKKTSAEVFGDKIKS